MKKLFFFLASILVLPAMTMAQQQGVIHYKMAINLRAQVAKDNPAVASMVPEKTYAAIDLTFRNENYAVATKQEKPAGGDLIQNSIQIMMSGLTDGRQIYNLKSKTGRNESIFNGKAYYTEAPLAPATAISYTNETKKILGYTCSKAIVTSPDKQKYTVWYTTSIPYPYNPEGDLFAGLKGAVLECSSDDHSVVATSLDVKAFSAAALASDPKAKKVTQEQMNDLQEDAAEDLKNSLKSKAKAAKK